MEPLVVSSTGSISDETLPRPSFDEAERFAIQLSQMIIRPLLSQLGIMTEPHTELLLGVHHRALLTAQCESPATIGRIFGPQLAMQQLTATLLSWQCSIGPAPHQLSYYDINNIIHLTIDNIEQELARLLLLSTN